MEIAIETSLTISSNIPALEPTAICSKQYTPPVI